MDDIKLFIDNMINDIGDINTCDKNYTNFLHVKANIEIIYYYINLIDNIISKNIENMIKN